MTYRMMPIDRKRYHMLKRFKEINKNGLEKFENYVFSDHLLICENPIYF